MPLAQCAFSNNVTFREPTYAAAIQYEPSKAVTLYASFRHGFRSGGFSTRATSFISLTPFKQEFVNEYELGLKTTTPLGAGRLTTSTALFRQDGTDVQKQRATFVNGNVFTIVDNTAKQRNTGGKFEATFTGREFSLRPFTATPGCRYWRGPRRRAVFPRSRSAAYRSISPARPRRFRRRSAKSLAISISSPTTPGAARSFSTTSNCRAGKSHIHW